MDKLIINETVIGVHSFNNFAHNNKWVMTGCFFQAFYINLILWCEMQWNNSRCPVGVIMHLFIWLKNMTTVKIKKLEMSTHVMLQRFFQMKISLTREQIQIL